MQVDVFPLHQLSTIILFFKDLDLALLVDLVSKLQLKTPFGRFFPGLKIRVNQKHEGGETAL